MDNMERIAAISWAARRAGERYGTFLLHLTTRERNKIYREFGAWKRAELEWIRSRHEREGEPLSPKASEPVREKSRRGGRAFSFDTAAAARLYRQGKNDRQIGAELGMSGSAIRNWRKRQGLTAVTRKCG